jgi:hypothetical protein
LIDEGNSSMEKLVRPLTAGSRPRHWLLGVAIVAVLAGSAQGDQPASGVTLLVPGIKLALDKPGHPWGVAAVDAAGGVQWSGMIGSLRKAGHRFGGVIRAGSRDAANASPSDTAHSDGDPRQATLFELEFSPSADRDGLAYKALELTSAIDALKRLTGTARVRLVAYSAGGLVARAYLQSALPEVPYRGDVERLITIATPHLGSAAASRLGDLLGTRATAIGTDAELIRRLNEELELPADVLSASIIVRGVGIGMAGLDLSSRSYDRMIDQTLVSRLPIDFRQGGDQVVDVRSQNLRLTAAAARYERRSEQPVLYLLARVADPTPLDRSPRDLTVHDAATSDPWVTLWVELLLAERTTAWSELTEPHLSRWIGLQAKLFAYGLIEDQAARQLPFWEITQTEVLETSLVGQSDRSWLVRFSGRASATRKFLPGRPRVIPLSGAMRLEFDRFGRVTNLQSSMLESAPVASSAR